MSIIDKVREVEQLFADLQIESTTFQENTSIGCAPGCGKCCTYPDIEASPLEFLPWAFHLFINGQAENTRVQLKEITTPTCFIYKSTTLIDQGRCGNYKYRGLICRLFGFAANSDKYGKLRLASCNVIKERQPKEHHATNEAINSGLSVPIFTEYYMRLNSIDFQLTNKMYPVNQALLKALEEVLHYYAYRPSTDLGKNCG